MRISKVFLLLGLVMGLVSALFLYFGSVPIPWSIQSWNGSSSDERAFHLAEDREINAGLILLIISFLLQLLGTFWEDIIWLLQKVVSRK